MTKRDHESLDPSDWSRFRELGRRMIDDVADHFARVRERRVWQQVPPEIVARFEEPVPLEPQEPEDTYRDFREQVMPYTIGNTHPRFWGWVVGSGTHLGALTELLAGALNVNAGGNDAANFVETQVIGWLKTMLGYPSRASGLLVSGGSMANIIGLAVARNTKADFDVRREGLFGRPRMTLYTSVELHGSIVKAAELLGLGRDSIRMVPVDRDFRVDLTALEAAIADDRALGCQPFCIVGHAGTVNTGAIDDLAGLARIAKREGLWFHVDGAFGALAALAPDLRPLIAGMEQADSLAFDLHKWMHLPYDVGCVLIADELAHRKAFAFEVDYIKPARTGPTAMRTRFLDYDIVLSRSFRALKVWMHLKAFGARKFGRLIQQNVEQARYLAQMVTANPTLELAAPISLNVVTFRFVGEPRADDRELDEINEELMYRFCDDGTFVVSSTELDGRFVLRTSIINHRTRRDDLELLVAETERCGREILANRRSRG